MTTRTSGVAYGRVVAGEGRRCRAILLVPLGLAVLIATGCETAGLTPSASVTTTTPGVTESWFKLDWSVEPEAGDRRKIDGHVENVSGWGATDVQLLVQSLDAAGNLVAQRREWLGGSLPSGSRTFFAIRHLAAADRYRVSVWSYRTFRSD